MYIDTKSISQKMTDAFYRNKQTIDELFEQEYEAQFIQNESMFKQEYSTHDCTYADVLASSRECREYDLKQENDYQRYLRYKRESAAKSAKDIREAAKLEKLRQELDIVLD